MAALSTASLEKYHRFYVCPPQDTQFFVVGPVCDNPCGSERVHHAHAKVLAKTYESVKSVNRISYRKQNIFLSPQLLILYYL